jgi:hypothetical protein
MKSGWATSACLWCGHEEKYRPNNQLSVTHAKNRMKKHERSCEESPTVKEMEQLRSVNRQLTSVFQQKKGATTLLENYINPRRNATANVLLEDLGALARDTAPHDDVLVYLRRDNPNSCAVCGDITKPAVSMRVIAPAITHVALLCQGCAPTRTRTPKETIDSLTESSEMTLLEMAFLWRDEQRTRMLWGDRLTIETIR